MTLNYLFSPLINIKTQATPPFLHVTKLFQFSLLCHLGWVGEGTSPLGRHCLEGKSFPQIVHVPKVSLHHKDVSLPLTPLLEVFF